MKKLELLEMSTLNDARNFTYQSNVVIITFQSHNVLLNDAKKLLDTLLDKVLNNKLDIHIFVDNETLINDVIFHVVLIHSFQSLLLKEISEYLESNTL